MKLLFAILDGANQKIHILNEEGMLQITCDAAGSNIENGDVLGFNAGFDYYLLQSLDGTGRRYQYLKDGIAGLRGTLPAAFTGN